MADDLDRPDDAGPRGDAERALERVSDADRERAAELVRNALGDGLLGMDELDERLGGVMAARTRGDLEAALLHLPGAAGVLAAGQPLRPVARPDEPVVLQGSSTSLRRTGRWEVPARLAIRAKASSIILDFVEATLPGPEILVELDLKSSSLRLIVPPDVVVEEVGLDQHASSLSIHRPRDPRPPRAVIRVTGSIRTSGVVSGGPGWWRRRMLRKAARQRRALGSP